MARTTTITNVSPQAVPILVNSIDAAGVESASTVARSVAAQLVIVAGGNLVVESSRVDLAQLEQLRRKGLIQFTAF